MALVPLGLLAWIGLQLDRDEHRKQTEIQQQQLKNRLAELGGRISDLIRQRERDVENVAPLFRLSAAEIREVVRNHPTFAGAFVLDPEGRLRHPPIGEDPSPAERRFFDRTRSIWESGERFIQREDRNPLTTSASQAQRLETVHTGWYTWYWGRGLHLLYWRKDDSGFIYGVELDRSRFLSDIIAALPETASASVQEYSDCTSVRDEQGQVLYQWGECEFGLDRRSAASFRLATPLSGWTLDHTTSSTASPVTSKAVVFNLFAGIGVAGVAVIALAIFVYRESTREIREAGRRVSFVNRVSHELKTPLTNIRMYVELMAASPDRNDSRVQRHVQVIVSESQRLSRLIDNVLTFSRHQQKKETLHLRPAIPDEVIDSVLESFAPVLEEAEIKVLVSRSAAETVMIDVDAVEQILGNLITNVVQHAAGGKKFNIVSRQTESQVVVEVADEGPGISESRRAKIFEPFERASDTLTESGSGAGLGLAIARDLARLHGGDVTVIDSRKGACFEVSLLARSDEARSQP
jgi:signal transduction histidine kinase